MKILVDYPSVGEEAAVVGRSLQEAADVRECLSLEDLRRHAQTARTVMVDRAVIGYAVTLADATRHPAKHGLDEIANLIEFGPARAVRSASSRRRGRWRCCAAADMSSCRTSVTWRRIFCATASCCPMTPSARG